MSFNDTEMTSYFVAIMHERTVIKTPQYYNFKMETKEQSGRKENFIFAHMSRIADKKIVFLSFQSRVCIKLTSVKTEESERGQKKPNFSLIPM